MAAGARVTLDERGIDDLFESAATIALVGGTARALAGAARDLAPDGGPARGVRETYRATKPTREGDRIVATAYTDDTAGHLVEHGSAKNTAYAPLRRAAQRLGFRVTLAPKGS